MSDTAARGRALIGLLQQQVAEADSSIYEVGEQRERNYRYYTLQPIGNEMEGCSHYISPDVFDVVESKKAHFDETFNSGRDLVRFDAGTGSKDEADAKTAYVNEQLKRNEWEALSRDGWHDAFVAKRMTVLPEWIDEQETSEEQVQNLTGQALQQAMQSDPAILEVNPVDGQTMQHPVAGELFSGTLAVTRDTGHVRISLIAQERYYRDQNVAYAKDAAFAGFHEDVTRAGAINRGYDAAQISKLKQEYQFRRREEDNARKRHDSSWTRRRMHSRSIETEEITIYRTWTWIDASHYEELTGERNPGTLREINPESLVLVQVHWAEKEILNWSDGRPAISIEEEIPFLEWTEHKIAHAEHGLATADVVAETQKANSTLKRLVIDNQHRRNTTGYEAQHNAIMNPLDLLDQNKIGRVIWSKRLGSVVPLATPELSPLTMNAIEMLDQDKEERGGMSRLAQGLNTDVVRYQNAADMVERLTNNANKRISRAARDYAKTFLVPLAKAIVRLGMRNDQKAYAFEISGEQQMVSPQQWNPRNYNCTVHTALTPDEGLKLAQSLLMMDQQMTMKKQTDPAWGAMYGAAQQHALYDDVFDALGVKDTSRYMAQPDSPEVVQQLQAMQMQNQQMMQQQQQMLMAQLQAMMSQDQREWFRAQLDGQKVQIDAADKATDNALEEEKFKHQTVVDLEELRLEREQGKDVSRATSVASKA